MNTFDTLTDAFTELERRADTAAQATGDATTRATARHHSRAPLVAASVIATLAVAGGVAVLAHHGGHTQPSGGSPQVQPPQRHQAASTASPEFQIPQTAADLEARFRTVLGDLATFTVTDTGSAVNMSVPPTRLTVRDPSGKHQVVSAVAGSGTSNGAAIVGTLTSHGVTGGYDIQIFQSSPGEKAMCDDGELSKCTISTTADGSSLAVGREPLQTGGPGGVTYQVDLVRTDGVEFLMHVSNERDPKGESPVLAPQPPLTTDQMVSVVTSERW